MNSWVADKQSSCKTLLPYAAHKTQLPPALRRDGGAAIKVLAKWNPRGGGAEGARWQEHLNSSAVSAPSRRRCQKVPASTGLPKGEAYAHAAGANECAAVTFRHGGEAALGVLSITVRREGQA